MKLCILHMFIGYSGSFRDVHRNILCLFSDGFFVFYVFTFRVIHSLYALTMYSSMLKYIFPDYHLSLFFTMFKIPRFICMYKKALLVSKSNPSLFFTLCFLDLVSCSTPKIPDIFVMLL